MAPISKEQRNQLLLAAQKARERAYAPYSKFRVGAALLLKDGGMITGCNVENASYGAGICAERTALVSAVAAGRSNSFLAIAVSSDLIGPCSPCGICRQFIREFCELSMPILMVSADWQPTSDLKAGGEGVSQEARNLARPYDEDDEGQSSGLEEEEGVTIRTLGQLLPLSFGPDDLGRGKIPDGAP